MLYQNRNEYVRYENGGEKYYRAILSVDGFEVRLSRRKFRKASGAIAYHRRFLERIGCQREMIY